MCSRGSNESAKGRRPVSRAYNMTPSAQMSWLGCGRLASDVWGRRISGAAYGRDPGWNECAGSAVDVELRWRALLWRCRLTSWLTFGCRRAGAAKETARCSTPLAGTGKLMALSGGGGNDSSSPLSSSSDVPIRRLIPKSPILQTPVSSTSTFSSFMSRCTYPASSCRYRRPRTTWRNIIPASSCGSAGRPSRLRMSNSDPAGQYTVKK